MPFNNGVYNKPDLAPPQGHDSFVEQANNGGDPSPEMFDFFLNDVAAGFNRTLLRDGTAQPTHDISFNSKKITNLAPATENSDAVTFKQLLDRSNILVNDVTYSSNTYTLNPTPAIPLNTAARGLVFKFFAPEGNEGATSIVLNTNETKALTKTGTIPLSTGDIRQNSAVFVIYDGVRFQLMNPNGILTLTGNVSSFRLINGVNGRTYTLLIRQDGTGGRTLPLPSSWIWRNGSVGSVASAAGASSILTIRQIGTDLFPAPLLKSSRT